MNIEQTFDQRLIKKVMTDSEMWEKIGVDGIKKEDFSPVLRRNMLVIKAVVENVIGLHLFVHKPSGVVFHPMLLKPFRKDYGREFIKNGLEWFFDNTNMNSLFVEIPEHHQHNINLATKFNFKDVGIKKEAMKKNGITLDLRVMKLEKGDI